MVNQSNFFSNIFLAPGAPGHVFIIPLGQNNGNEKGPDTQAEAFRQMLAQHMVNI